MFVYCLVLVSVVQVPWSQSLQEMHRTKPLYFFAVGNALGADGTRVNIWGPGLLSTCSEEARVVRRSV